MKREHSAAALLLAILFGLTTVAFAQTQSGDEWRWTGKLSPDQLVEIKNVNGAIEATGVAGDTIEVVAVKSGEDKDQVHVEMVNGPEGITICAVYPGRGSSCTSGSDWRQNVRDVHAKVDFQIRLPRTLRFDARSVNGRVRAEELGRVVKASTVNGGVDVSTDSWAEATSVNGSMKVRMGRADWNGALKLSTVNGSVDLDMPANLDTDVHFSSVNGSLNSDLPVTVTRSSGRWGPKSMDGRIGSGGRELRVETVNGSLHIRSGKAGL